MFLNLYSLLNHFYKNTIEVSFVDIDSNLGQRRTNGYCRFMTNDHLGLSIDTCKLHDEHMKERKKFDEIPINFIIDLSSNYNNYDKYNKYESYNSLNYLKNNILEKSSDIKNNINYYQPQVFYNYYRHYHKYIQWGGIKLLEYSFLYGFYRFYLKKSTSRLLY